MDGSSLTVYGRRWSKLSPRKRKAKWFSEEGLQTAEKKEKLKAKAMTPHSSTLAWKIPWTEEPVRLQSMGSLRVEHDWATSLSLSCVAEGNGNPLQCSCLENPRDRGAYCAPVSGVAQSRTQLKRLSTSSSKGKGEKESYIHLNAEFQRKERRDKKTFWSKQCKELKENNTMGKTRDCFKKIRDTRDYFTPRWAQ